MNLGLLSVYETVSAKELVVPLDKLSVDGVVVSDELSVCDTGEVEVGINVSKSLFNSVENAVNAGFVSVLRNHGKILLISSEPDNNVI